MANKKIFISLILLMTFSLIGMVIIQGYWIESAVTERSEQFSHNVNYALSNISEDIRENEINVFLNHFPELKEFANKPTFTESEIRFRGFSTDKSGAVMFTQKVLEGDVTIPLNIISQNNKDSLRLQTNFNYSDIFAPPSSQGDISSMLPDVKISYGNNSDQNLKLSQINSMISIVGDLTPIQNRVDTSLIRKAIDEQLDLHHVNTRYQYAILDGDTMTDIRSQGYEPDARQQYKAPLFEGKDGVSRYQIALVFPHEGKFIVSALFPMILLSIVFILIIVLTYSYAFYYLVKQKRISDVKNDFINNMTHEFKTPIATINIAADSIRSPLVICNAERVNHYADIIKQENRRMLKQVESVLQIARLERHQMELHLQQTDLNGLLLEAVEHIELIVQERGGEIEIKLEAEKVTGSVDRMHLEHTILNILDNANKYSSEKPYISIRTFNTPGRWVMEVKDRGMGISEATLKKIFEKFYRIPTGDVHNIKGHGLGLAYAKSIVELHGGKISAESEKGNGSTLRIEIPVG